MFKYIILYLSVCLCGVLCDLNKEEGAECEWEGVKGTCVKETRCLTTLDDQSPKQTVCSKKGEETIVCCTDCELVNDTRNVVISPTSGLFWKDGSKARDSCLQYLKELPYQCRHDGFHGGIKRDLDAEKKCHIYQTWGTKDSPKGDQAYRKYPHEALLGYGEDLETAKWSAGGTIISDRFILTAAHTNTVSQIGKVKYIALNVQNLTDPSSTWQTHKVKRFIAYPKYTPPTKYHDIALVETETPIKFDNNVLPACLIVQESEDDKAIATTWRDLEGDNYYKKSTTIQTLNLEKFSEEECRAAYGPYRNLPNGYDSTTQICYGSKTNPSRACRGLSGEALLINTQFSQCLYTVIGVTSFGTNTCGLKSTKPDVYTRVSNYVPWIESVVWP